MKLNVFLFGFKPKTHCIYQFCFCQDNTEYFVSSNKYFKVNCAKKKKSVSFLISSYNLQNTIKVLDDSLLTSVPYDAILIGENFHFR